MGARMNKEKHFPDIKPIDFVPAFSGLVGKAALTASFALVWAKELGIQNESFVFENVRLELLVGSLLTLLFSLVWPTAAPAGTLAPLLILVPFMVACGAHPLVFGVLVGVLGLVFVRIGLFQKVSGLSSPYVRTCLTLSFGLSGSALALGNLFRFFEKILWAAALLLLLLGGLFFILRKRKKTWLMIPLSAAASLGIPMLFGIFPAVSSKVSPIRIDPSWWWNEMWGIGFGLSMKTLLVTLPFALFAVFLWTIDAAAVETIREAQESTKKVGKIDSSLSFYAAAIRNLAGSILGGAQTASIWRSFLIPLYMVNRPMRVCAVLLGTFGVAAAVTAIPVQLMSYVPLVWSVLLFGIFMPFLVVSLSNLLRMKNGKKSLPAILFSLAGAMWSPILTWLLSGFFERLFFSQKPGSLSPPQSPDPFQTPV